MQPRKQITSVSQSPAQFIISAVLGLILFLLVYQFFPIGNDYYYFYRPVAEHWLSGNPSMQGNAGNVLRYPPWTLIYLVIPLGLPPTLALGSAVLTFTSLVLLAASVYLFLRMHPAPALGVVLALVNLFVIELLLMGQIDAFSLFGVMVGWWAVRTSRPWLLGFAVCLMGLKPLNLIPTGLLFLIAIRHWPLRHLIKACILPTAMIVSSILIAGLDFFTVYSGEMTQAITGTAIILWRGLDLLGMPAWPFVLIGLLALGAALLVAWRTGLSARTYTLIICTTFVFTPYAHADYYVLMIPAFIYVWRLNWRVGLIVYITSFSPLLRLLWGHEISFVSLLFPSLLLVSAWLLPRMDVHHPRSI